MTDELQETEIIAERFTVRSESNYEVTVECEGQPTTVLFLSGLWKQVWFKKTLLSALR